jgi:hypothetical protein
MEIARRCRFVQGDVVRLALSGGEWVDVKAELNAGEARHMFSASCKDVHAGERVTLDLEKVGLTKILEYVVGWSLLGTDDRPEPVSESAIVGLDQDTYVELEALVEAHDRASADARRARKNGQDGEKGSAAISPSRDAAAGASTMSAA